MAITTYPHYTTPLHITHHFYRNVGMHTFTAGFDRIARATPPVEDWKRQWKSSLLRNVRVPLSECRLRTIEEPPTDSRRVPALTVGDSPHFECTGPRCNQGEIEAQPVCTYRYLPRHSSCQAGKCMSSHFPVSVAYLV